MTLFGVSVAGVLAGVLTYPIQEKWNLNKAERFIAKIENFNTENGRYPQSSYEIEIPISRNGFYEKEFEYYLPAENEGEYIIKYFDGFWNTKVYVSKENKWYTDD
ncbi:hypothetical protein H4O20_13475 [Aequorivita sp. 609]|uniref:hypothetical protein n=1 Tax=Aequorivita TaxID=153265 RepID=UPI00160C7711|nr:MULTISPECIES: hypothetical protein [Aequorivita]MBB6682455.1 hypothetical protein [Aequorivita sp. 609]